MFWFAPRDLTDPVKGYRANLVASCVSTGCGLPNIVLGLATYNLTHSIERECAELTTTGELKRRGFRVNRGGRSPSCG